jgi:hypothetical protein
MQLREIEESKESLREFKKGLEQKVRGRVCAIRAVYFNELVDLQHAQHGAHSYLHSLKGYIALPLPHFSNL